MVLGVQILTLFGVGGYRGVWRYFGLMDGVVFTKGVLLGTLAIVFSVTYLYRFENYSRGVFVIYAALLLLMLIISRASFRLIGEFIQRRKREGARLAIYGAGGGGAATARELLGSSSQQYRMLGFIDDDPEKTGTRFQGYRVLGGYEELVKLVHDGAVDSVVISIRMLDGARLRDVRALCDENGVMLSKFKVDIQHLGEVSRRRPAESSLHRPEATAILPTLMPNSRESELPGNLSRGTNVRRMRKSTR